MRVALGVSYRGTRFHGWQSQPSGRGIQDHLQQALARVAGGAVTVVAAGRTDTGVHAQGQEVHFDPFVERPLTAWVRGTNAFLDRDVAVNWAVPVGPDFHARHSATSRSYQYWLYNAPVRPSVLDGLVGWIHTPLEIERMQDAARALTGEHDFTSFRSAHCQARSPVRELTRCDVESRGNYVRFALTANGFLHHMVRNIVGALIYVGSGRLPVSAMLDLLEARDRRTAPPTFSPDGLCLTRVGYPAPIDLPQPDPLPWP